jgi:hypothetical protein
VTVSAILQDMKKIETEALVVVFFEDVRPLKGLAGELDWLLCGALSGLLLSGKLRGRLGDTALLTSQGKLPAQKVFMIGLGPRKGLSAAVLESAALHAAAAAASAGVTRAAMEFLLPQNTPPADAVRSIYKGLREGVGGRRLDLALVAPDASLYDKINRVAKH